MKKQARSKPVVVSVAIVVAFVTGVEIQSEKYSKGFPESYAAEVRALPFQYQNTGVETRFTNLLDPAPRSRHGRPGRFLLRHAFSENLETPG